MTRVSPDIAGDAPSPKPILVFITPKSFCHLRLPSKSKQYNPREPKKAHTSFPSVTGEPDAKVLLSWWPSCGEVSRATFCHRILPEPRSTQKTVKRNVPLGAFSLFVCAVGLSTGTAESTNTRSPQMIGVASPSP